MNTQDVIFNFIEEKTLPESAYYEVQPLGPEIESSGCVVIIRGGSLTSPLLTDSGQDQKD